MQWLANSGEKCSSTQNLTTGIYIHFSSGLALHWTELFAVILPCIFFSTCSIHCILIKFLRLPSNFVYSCKTNLHQLYLHPVSQTVVHLISTCITPFFELIRWYFWLIRPLWTTSVRLISTFPKHSYIGNDLRN